MAHPATIDLEALLPPDVFARLTAAAEHEGLALGDLVRAALVDYVSAFDDDHEDIADTPDEEILADFREAWHDAMTGNTVPAEEALVMLRKKWAAPLV